MARGKKTGGRKAGTPNKITALAREAIAEFVGSNAGRLQEWLDAIASENPEKAFYCFMSVVEYYLPKLQRREYDGDNAQHHVVERKLTPAEQAIVERYLTLEENQGLKALTDVGFNVDHAKSYDENILLIKQQRGI